MAKEDKAITWKGTKSELETVLVALVGLSPAVLTETIWALAESVPPIVPNRVVVLTTRRGRECLLKLFETGTWNHFIKAIRNHFGPVLDEKLKFGPVGECIRVFPSSRRDRELEDIRNREDNEIVADMIMETIRGLAEDENIRIIASLAGGRKTMGALLHSVMTLLGRHQDGITHVLVSEPWDRVPFFYYPGCEGVFRHPDTGENLSARDVAIELAEVPFVPIRYMFATDLQRPKGGYMRLIQRLRNRAISLDDELEIEVFPEGGILKINGKAVPLSSLEFAFYFYFAKRTLDKKPPVESFKTLDDAIIGLARTSRKENDFSHWSNRVLEADFDCVEDARKWAGNIRVHLRKLGFDGVQIEHLVPNRRFKGIRINAGRIRICLDD